MNRLKVNLMVAFSTLILVMIAGCANKAMTVEPAFVDKLPYHFQLDFASRLPEYVYTTRGPIDSHKRYRVNELLKAGLEMQLMSRSSSDSAEKVIVTVNVLELKFDYEEIGGGGMPLPWPLVASRGLLPGGLFSAKEDDGGGFDIPYETVKTAIIRLQISLRGNAQDYGRYEKTGTFVEKIHWDDMYASWPYDYHTFDNVITGVIEAAISLVDSELEKQFSRP